MAVACGYGHTCAIGERGEKLWAFGRGGHGQLGTGQCEHRRLPAPVPGLGEKLGKEVRLVMVAAGGNHSAAVTSEGDLLTWGSGGFGQLGRGNEETRPAVAKLPRVFLAEAAVTMVSCGGRHTVVVTELGAVFSFGYGGAGQLGHGDRSNRVVPVQIEAAQFRMAKIVFVAAGISHSGAVSSEGVVWTWGSGEFGQLGLGDELDQLVPREIVGQFGGSKAVMLAAGGAHSMALTSDGALWAWGWGEYGQLGLGNYVDRRVPVRVGGGAAFGHCRVLTIACGNCHSMCVTEGGILWSWGYGEGGLLGHKDRRNRVVPEPLGAERFQGAKIVSAACGVDHSAAVTQNGDLYTWGRGTPYPGSKEPTGLGHDDLEDTLVPRRVGRPRLLGERSHPLSRLHAVAFAMGTHSRLGAGVSGPGGGIGRKTRRDAGMEAGEEGKVCVIMALAGEPGLVQMVVEAYRGWPEVGEAEAEGVLRLVGGGSSMEGKGTGI